jgi:hypothetical protein
MITPKDEEKLKSLIKTELTEIKHNCLHEGDLAKLIDNNTKIINDYYGNGQEGSRRLLTRLSEQVSNLAQSTSAHTKVISDLVAFQSSHDGEIRGKKQDKDDKFIADNLKAQKRRDLYWRIATIVTILLTVIGLIIAILKLYSLTP